eukprot:1493896-Pleurochrysis_carterae.AAC.2
MYGTETSPERSQQPLGSELAQNPQDMARAIRPVPTKTKQEQSGTQGTGKPVGGTRELVPPSVPKSKLARI